MDHFLPIQDPAYEEPNVPLLHSHAFPYTYDGQGMAEYPPRVGWNLKKLFWYGCWQQGNTKTVDEFASLLQAWLFFGLLSEFLGSSFRQQDFIRTNSDGMKSVTTKRLRSLILDMWEKVEELSAEQQKTYHDKMKTCFGPVQTVFHYFCSPKMLPPASLPHLPQELMLSIELLVYRMQHALNAVNWAFERNGDFGSDLGANQPIVAKLRDQYCPYEVNYLWQRFHPLSLYYLSRIRKPKQDNHSSCSSNQCSALTVDENTYRTKHTTPTCSCKFISADQRSINQILSATKSFPLVRLPPGKDDDSYHLDTVEWTGQNYAAISHVWVDGLVISMATHCRSANYAGCSALSTLAWAETIKKHPSSGSTPAASQQIPQTT